MIDGFRSGFIGHADAAPSTGAVVLITCNAALLALCLRLVVRGYRLKA
jgi:ABC-2 type transport system permease protein